MKTKRKERSFNVGNLIQLVEKEGIDGLHWVNRRTSQASAEEFLGFAKEDISEKGVRGRINALCNAKRAIENRIDVLIYKYGLDHHSKKNRWNFPMKMDRLSRLDIRIPNVLQNMITSKRNLLEHEYVIPKNQREVEDIIDIAELFLTASQSFLEMGSGSLAMINTPPGGPHSSKWDRGRPPYVILFNSEGNSIRVYKDDWQAELKVDDIEEKDQLRLMRAIKNSSPTMQAGYNLSEWEEGKIVKLAENMIS